MPLVWLLLSLSVAAAKKKMEKGGKSSKDVSRLLLIRYNSTKLRSRVCFYIFILFKIGRERTEEEKGGEESVARITSQGRNTEDLCEWNLIQKMCCLLWRKTREGRYLHEWTDWIFPTAAWRCTCVLDYDNEEDHHLKEAKSSSLRRFFYVHPRAPFLLECVYERANTKTE